MKEVLWRCGDLCVCIVLLLFMCFFSFHTLLCSTLPARSCRLARQRRNYLLLPTILLYSRSRCIFEYLNVRTAIYAERSRWLNINLITNGKYNLYLQTKKNTFGGKLIGYLVLHFWSKCSTNGDALSREQLSHHGLHQKRYRNEITMSFRGWVPFYAEHFFCFCCCSCCSRAAGARLHF